TLHARLRAGEQALAGTVDSELQSLRRELEHARDASTATWLRETLAAARRGGIEVEHRRGSVVFSRPGTPSIVASTDEQGSLADGFHRQRLVEQLAGLGLQVRRGARGQLIATSAHPDS